METRYGHYQYDSSHSNYSPTVNTLYNDTYSQLESPEKVNSLERNKKLLQAQVNALDSAVYGGTNSYGQNNQQDHQISYNSFGKSAPKFTPSPARPPLYTSKDYKEYKDYQESKPYSPTTSSSPQSPYKLLPTGSISSPKPITATSFDYTSAKPTSHITFERFQPSEKPLGFVDYNKSGDGFSTSEYSTSTSKIPGGYKTDSYKYETYKSSSQPTYSSMSEKYYTSTPNAKLQLSPFDKKNFESFSNGTSDNQYQSSFSSNVEYINEPPVLKDNDTLEQKMLKKSVTQQIIEKKTVQMTKSSKQESSTKSFKFE